VVCEIEACSTRWCSQVIKSIAKPANSNKDGKSNAKITARKPAIQAEPGVFMPLAEGQKLGNTMNSL
jgi:hypothetical protein